MPQHNGAPESEPLEDTAAVVLAAGEGTRMNSSRSKVLHRVGGRPLVERVVSAVQGAGISRVAVVVQSTEGPVADVLGDQVVCVAQEEQLGTGHAVGQAEQVLQEWGSRQVLVLYADMPLVTAELLRGVAAAQSETGAAAVLVSTTMEDPTGYGRVVRGDDGDLKKVVEESDATPEERAITEINTGIGCFRQKSLLAALPYVDAANRQGEYYLVDVFPWLASRDRVVIQHIDDSGAVQGVNTRADLAQAEQVAQERAVKRLLAAGVTVVDPATTWVYGQVHVGQDSVIYPNSTLGGPISIDEEAEIGPGAHLTAVTAGSGLAVEHSRLEQSQLGSRVQVGPYSHIRPGCRLGDEVRVGNYAEVKNSQVGAGTKINHHSYIGDADIGTGVNIGAGVVTVNYDGREKHRTIIGDDAFIGCNVNLVAPVEVEPEGYVAAGSTITRDVPAKALAIARSRQSNKSGWVRRRFERMSQSKGGDTD